MFSLDEAAVVYNLIVRISGKNLARHDEDKTTNGDKKSQKLIYFFIKFILQDKKTEHLNTFPYGKF